MDPKPIDNPFLRVIRDEACRLPGGFLASSGHVSDVLGKPIHDKAATRALDAFCDEQGLDAAWEEPDGVRFTVRPTPAPPEPAKPAPAPPEATPGAPTPAPKP